MSLMTAAEVDEQVVQSLSPEEQHRLAEIIQARLTAGNGGNGRKQGRQLDEFRGLVQHPFFGEDAQEYISRTRREGDQHRESVLRGNP